MITNQTSSAGRGHVSRGEATRSTKWLVSVRDLQEARTATRYSVDILDFKEPSAGPLAPVDRQIWEAAVRWADQASGSIPLSAAMGELDQAIEICASVPSAFTFAKAGPSGASDESALLRKWDRIRLGLSKRVELVAVAYADHRSAGTVSADRIFSLAAHVGLRHVLIDTFDKSNASALQTLGPEGLIKLGGDAKRLGLWWALAGSVRLGDWIAMRKRFVAEEAGDRLPNCVGVRGDICHSNRSGLVCEQRLASWKTEFVNHSGTDAQVRF